MFGNWLTIFGGVASNILTFGFIAPFLMSAKDSSSVMIGLAVIVIQLFCDFVFGANFVKATKEVYNRYVG